MLFENHTFAWDRVFLLQICAANPWLQLATDRSCSWLQIVVVDHAIVEERLAADSGRSWLWIVEERLVVDRGKVEYYLVV